MKNWKGNKGILCPAFWFSLLSSLALCMGYCELQIEPDPALSVAANACNNFFARWAYAVQGKGYLMSCLAIGGAFFYSYYRRKEMGKERLRFSRICAAVLALLQVYGKTYFANPPFAFNPFQTMQCILGFVGMYWLYYVILHTFYYFIKQEVKRVPLVPEKIKKMFWKHPFSFSFCFLMIAWLGHIVVKYPASFCWDASYQLDQGMGSVPLTAHHPVFHTMLMSWFVKLGRVMGSTNVGIFLFVVVEAVVLALIFAYGIRLLVEMKARKWTILLSMILCGASPFIIGYVGTVIKDVYFSAFCVLYILLLGEYCLRRDVFTRDVKRPLLLVLSCVGMVLFRNNGIYMIAPTVLLLVIRELRGRRGHYGKMIVLMVMSVVIPLAASGLIKKIYQPIPGSKAEALSLPLQQTARFVKYHEDEVTEEEKQIIDQVVDYDILAENYKPHISDPIKSHYNWGATGEDLKAYFKVWFQQFLKEPVCYVNSVLEQNIYLVYPEYSNYAYYIDCNEHRYEYGEGEYFVTPQWLKQWQPAYRKFLQALHASPVLQLINNMAVYVIAFLFLLVFQLHRRSWRDLCYMVPLLISIAVIILAPCILGHPRYAYPLIYVFPFLLGFFNAGKRVEGGEE